MMLELTFGEQVKIVLSRKNMTIKQLAEQIEIKTGTKMSRQNLTQRLGRDNFQEQDMRMIAEILECPFQLSILGGAEEKVAREMKPHTPEKPEAPKEKPFEPIRETIKNSEEEPVEPYQPEYQREVTVEEIEPMLKKEPLPSHEGDINPYTGFEYRTNSVRAHSTRIGYVQVYDRKDHKWTEMTEWAFLGYQERQKLILGKSYQEPTYLD